MLSKNNIIIFVLFIIIGLLHFFVYSSNYPGLSGDDFFRALMTYEWSESHFTFTDEFGQYSLMWFPAHFWIAGSLFYLLGNLYLSLTVLSLFFGFLQITFLYYLTKTIFDRSTAIISIFFIGFLPFQIWLNLSMTAMTIYLFSISAGCLFFYKWMESFKLVNLILSSLFFLFSTMLRPEGWVLTLLFTFAVITLITYSTMTKRINKEKYVSIIIVLTIPYLFIFSWLLYNYIEFGDFLYFLKANKIFVTKIFAFSQYRSFFLGLQIPAFLFFTSPLLTTIIIVSILAYYKKLRYNQRLFLYFIIAQFLFLIGSFLSGAGTVAAPQRYAMGTLLLLIPYAAFGIDTLLKHKYGQFIFFFVCFTYLMIGITKSFMFSDIYLDAIETGKFINKNYENHFLLPDERICTDYTFRKITEIPFTDQKDYFIQASAHAAITVYSSKPKNFVLNILKMDDRRSFILRKSGFPKKAIDPKSLSSELKKYNISKIILSDRNLIKMIPDSFEPLKIIGQYVIFSNTKDQFIYNNRKINSIKESFVPLNLNLNKSTTLIGYRYDGLVFKSAVSLLWKIENVSEIIDCEVQIILTNINDPKIEKIISIKPIINWLCNNTISKGPFVVEKIPISLPSGFPGGKYEITLSLINNKYTKIQSNQKNLYPANKIKLEIMEIIPSKRQMLLDAIIFRDFDLIILAKTLLII